MQQLIQNGACQNVFWGFIFGCLYWTLINCCPPFNHVLCLHAVLLTKVFAFDWRDLAEASLDKKVEMWNDDEGWGQAGSWVVLLNQVVTLKLPIGVTVFLYLWEGVAVNSQYKCHYAYTENGFIRTTAMELNWKQPLEIKLYLNIAMSRLTNTMLVNSR